MNITVTQKHSVPGFNSLIFASLLVLGAYYWFLMVHTPFVWLGVGVCGLSVLGFGHSLWKHSLLIVIDDTGIYDRRLGVGKIMWSDVEDVQLQLTETNRFLCLKVRDPAPYVARLRGADRERVMFHQRLGFQGFNVDVDPVNVNLLDLKKQIDDRVRRPQNIGT